MIKDAARTLVAAVLAAGFMGYLVLRPIVRRDPKPANVIRRPRTGPLR